MKDMLSGKQPLSVADAYFTMEQAYGNCYLTQKEFQTQIKRSADFIREWMRENDLDSHNNEDMHLAIQRFMSEQLTIYKSYSNDNLSIKSATHNRFYYDYDDYQGEKDYKNYFLTKCLATGSGQCSSLPAVYLCLAEAIGAKAYLSLAPQHALIKYPDNKGHILNYEPTSNWKMSDKWYMDYMGITGEARRNHIFLDTFNSRQIVADAVIFLGLSYLKKNGSADGSFVMDCIHTANSQFAHDNVIGHTLYSSLLARMLNAIIYNEGIKNDEQLAKSEAAMEYYKGLEQNEIIIKQLGYTPIPEQFYNDMLKEQEFKGKAQQSLGIDTKKKRDLFIETH